MSADLSQSLRDCRNRVIALQDDLAQARQERTTLQVLLAWAYGDLTDCQAATALGVDRFCAEMLLREHIAAGVEVESRSWASQHGKPDPAPGGEGRHG